MQKPEFINKVSIVTNSESREVVMFLMADMPELNENHEVVGDICHVVSSVVLTEKMLSVFHKAAGDALQKLNESI